MSDGDNPEPTDSAPSPPPEPAPEPMAPPPPSRPAYEPLDLDELSEAERRKQG